MKRCLFAFLAVVFAVFLAGSARADTINVSYKVKKRQTGGFSASWLHTATGAKTTVSGVDYYMGGTITHELSGTINGTKDTVTGTVTFTSGTITATALTTNTSDFISDGTTTFTRDEDLTIKFRVGGTSSLAKDTSGSVDRPDGTWEVKIGNGTSSIDTDLTFIPHNFVSSAANRIKNDGTFLLWTNNYDATGSLSGTKRFGIDLHLEPVPEPGTLLLLGLGLVGLVAVRRRRDRDVADA